MADGTHVVEMDARKSRAARLKALREAKELLDDENKTEDKKVLRFRNYELRDGNIDHVKLPQVQPLGLDNDTPDSSIYPDLLTEGAMDVAPKKLNFDLKRDIDEKLRVLERRTHRALISLQQTEERRRLEEAGGIADEGDDDASDSIPSDSA